MYYPRFIDSYLSEWASRETHKLLLLRGARQVGKSTAVRHLAERLELCGDQLRETSVLHPAVSGKGHRREGACIADSRYGWEAHCTRQDVAFLGRGSGLSRVHHVAVVLQRGPA